jgi:glycosyltransferase involved in cell wall biosynthesis
MSKKTILFVAMPNSIHTSRWIRQLIDEGWDIHLYPSILAMLNPSINGITIHSLFYKKYGLAKVNHQNLVLKLFEKINYAILRRTMSFLPNWWQERKLARVINALQPDIIHTLEIQHAGYLVLSAKKHVKGRFPVWIVTNWGSDIFLFGRHLQHKEKIRQVLENCDYYSCECQRDVQLAKDFGFNKIVFPVFPNTGGFDLQKLGGIRCQQLTSSRKIIMLKGYEHWAGRALVALRALADCSDALKGYTVAIYSAAPIVIKKAKLLTEKKGIATFIIPNETSHDEILELHAQARISIGLSISDAISTSLLEAMVMGSFPIQSCTACADEWIEHGVSGMIVPAEESEIIAMWIRKALSDDNLVNNAAQINWQTALARLDDATLKQQAIAIYNAVEQR